MDAYIVENVFYLNGMSTTYLYILQFPKYHSPPNTLGCFIEWKIIFSSRYGRNVELQFVLDFYHTPYGRSTLRTGGLPHPVWSLHRHLEPRTLYSAVADNVYA